MKFLKRALVSGFAFVLIASAACAGTIGGFESFPAPVATMWLGGAGDSMKIVVDALGTANFQTSDWSQLPIIELTAVPEPPAYMLLGFGLLFCAQRLIRRRRKG